MPMPAATSNLQLDHPRPASSFNAAWREPQKRLRQRDAQGYFQLERALGRGLSAGRCNVLQQRGPTLILPVLLPRITAGDYTTLLQGKPPAHTSRRRSCNGHFPLEPIRYCTNKAFRVANCQTHLTAWEGQPLPDSTRQHKTGIHAFLSSHPLTSQPTAGPTVAPTMLCVHDL